jgi:chromosome segregation ATPase
LDEQHRRVLEALQQELQATEPKNESVKAHIETLKSQIDDAVSTSEEPAHNAEILHGLRQALERSIDDFAAYHPSLAEAIRVAINTLSNTGV